MTKKDEWSPALEKNTLSSMEDMRRRNERKRQYRFLVKSEGKKAKLLGEEKKTTDNNKEKVSICAK